MMRFGNHFQRIELLSPLSSFIYRDQVQNTFISGVFELNFLSYCKELFVGVIILQKHYLNKK